MDKSKVARFLLAHGVVQKLKTVPMG